MTGDPERSVNVLSGLRDYHSTEVARDMSLPQAAPSTGARPHGCGMLRGWGLVLPMRLLRIYYLGVTEP